MAFNLKKVLKALLLSSSQPISLKDIQAAFTRYHEGKQPVEAEDEALRQAQGDAAAAASAQDGGDGAAGAEAAPSADRDLISESPEDEDLYSDVPSLITLTQVREAMEAIAAELRAADDGLLLIEGSAGYRLVTAPRFARWVRVLRQEPPPARLSQSALETLAVVAYRQPVTRTEIETIRGVSAEAGLNRLIERELIGIVGRAEMPGRPIQYGTTDRFLEFVGIRSVDELPASDVLTSRQIDEWLRTSATPHKPGDAEMGLADEAEAAKENSPAEPASAPAQASPP